MNNPSQYNPQDDQNAVKPDNFVAVNELPIDKRRESLLEKIGSSPSVVLVGETGSGKTTRTPGYLLDEYPDKNIAITSPRVFPARSVSKYVASSRGGMVGGEVGIITRQERKISDETRATFMTDGVLLNMLRRDEMLSDLDIVMVDEAHERTINIDLLLGLLKQAQHLRKENGLEPLKIIIASATIEEEKFTTYFNEAPVEKVEGRMYPVDVSYHQVSEDPVTLKKRTLTEEAAILAERIINDPSSTGDILIFMPGEDEINKTIEVIQSKLNESEVTVLPLFGAMNPQDQDRIFGQSDKRKIIVSTNIAETSVTIDGVQHVIDSGSVKEKRYNPETGINSLEIIETSQANMNQRMGRAGRTAPGQCYRLMSRDDFSKREQFQKPEILRADLGEVVLRMKEMGIKDVEHFDFIDKPPRESIHAAVVQLTKLGALDKNGDITELGREMFELQLRPDLSRMIIEAKHLGVVPQMVDLCAMLSASKQILIRPRLNGPNEEENWRNEEKLSRQDTLRVAGSDILTMLNVWHAWNESGRNFPFAIDHLLNTKALNEVELIRMQLLRVLGEAGISSNGDDREEVEVNKLVKSILSGAPDALFFSNSERRYYQPIERDSPLHNVQIFPGSSAFKRGSNVILAMNVNRSEKMVTDRDSGHQFKRSALYGRVCHNVSLDDIRTVLGEDAVEEKAVGEPYYSIYNPDVGVQRYEVRVKGVLVDQISKDVYILEQGVQNWLPDIDYNNSRVVAGYDMLRKRSGGELAEIQLEDFYKRVIQEKGFTTKEDILEHASYFRVTLDDLVSPEELAAIERDSPKELVIQGKRFILEYVPNYKTDKPDVHIHIKDQESIQTLEETVLPEFPRVNKVLFSYRYVTFSSLEEIKTYIEEEKRKLEESIRQQMERHRKYQEMARGMETPTRHTVESKPKIKEPKPEKKVLTPEEQMVLWRNDADAAKHILIYLKDVVAEKNEKVFKDKQKVLDRIKEIRTECNSVLKNIDNKQEGDVSLEGRVSTFLRDVRVIIKRAQIEESDTSVETFKKAREQLYKAAMRNDAVLTEELQEKVAKKSAEIAMSEKSSITDDEADEILIDLI